MPNDTSNNRELRREYAYFIDTVANGASSCSGQNFSMDPLSENQGYPDSNLYRNNDFFYYQHNSADGNLTITINYTTASGTEANLDLYVYEDEGPFGFCQHSRL